MPSTSNPDRATTVRIEIPSAPRLRVAQLGERMAAGIVDGALYALAWLALARLGAFGSEVSRFGRLDLDQMARWVDNGAGLKALAGLWLLLSVVQGALGAAGGISLGRWLWGLQVVTGRGHPMSRGRGVLRGLLAALTTVMFGAGPAFVWVSRRQRALHDLMTGTWVVSRVDVATGGSPPPRAGKARIEPTGAPSRSTA